MGTEQQNIDHARDYRRYSERQIDQRGQQILAAKLEARNRPRGGDSKDRIEWDRNGRDQQRQPNRTPRFGTRDRREVNANSLAQASVKTAIKGMIRNTATKTSPRQ